MKKLKFDDSCIFDNQKEKSFYPIRYLLQHQDFDNLLEEENLNLLILFYLNASLVDYFDNKYFDSLKIDLTISYFVEIDVTLHFIKNAIVKTKENKIIIEILESTRLSMQNVIFSLFQRSFYIAFTEFRKCIEGILWINYFYEFGIKNIQRIDIEKSYSEWIEKYIPKMKKIWNELSNLIHYKKNIILIFFI